MAETVTIYIDDIAHAVPRGANLVDAAKTLGNDIPVFCYHPKLAPAGMCLMCLVEMGQVQVDKDTKQTQLDALKGGDAAFNARELRAMLRGDPGHNLAYRDAVLLNAAAALMVAGEAHNLRDAVEELAEVIDRGLAIALLDCWIAAVH